MQPCRRYWPWRLWLGGNDGEVGVSNNHAECSIVKGQFSIPRRRIAPPGVGWQRRQTRENNNLLTIEIVGGQAREDLVDDRMEVRGEGAEGRKQSPLHRQSWQAGGPGRTVGSADNDVLPLPRSDVSAWCGSSRTTTTINRAPLLRLGTSPPVSSSRTTAVGRDQRTLLHH